MLRSNTYDVIQLEGTFVTPYIDIIKQNSNAKTILRVHNLEYRIWQKLALNEKNIFKKWFYNHLANGVKVYEKLQFPKFDALASISEVETHQMLTEKYHTAIQTISAGVDIELFSNPIIEKDENSIFIISSLNWQPNIEAVLWFLETTFPLIVAQNPSVKLHIAGKNPPFELQKYASKNVVIHGFVPSAKKFMQDYNLMLVPLLSGGGMRIKIIEGMAVSKCIISSSLGAEGINYTPNYDLVICNNPQEWATAILDLLQNEKKIAQIEKNAFQTALKYYNNAFIIEKFEQLYRSKKLKEQ